MRRVLSVTLSAALALSIAACGRKPTAAAAPPRASLLTRVAPQAAAPQAGAAERGMPVYRPEPSVDYKIQIVRPNPKVDFKIQVVGPSGRDAPEGLAIVAPGAPTRR